ncbi:MAG TPA: Dabb family protein [Pseudolysinimonas sp.]
MTTLVHVVLIEWASPIDGVELSRLIDERLRGLPGVLSIAEGASVSPEGLEGGFDWGMVVTFNGAAARDAYLVDPDHAVVARFLTANAARVTVFDLAGS